MTLWWKITFLRIHGRRFGVEANHVEEAITHFISKLVSRLGQPVAL